MSLALLLCISEDVKRKLPDLQSLLCMHYVTALKVENISNNQARANGQDEEGKMK